MINIQMMRINIIFMEDVKE